jgi:hypothetical protein
MVVLDNCEHVLDTVAAVVGLALARDSQTFACWRPVVNASTCRVSGSSS